MKNKEKKSKQKEKKITKKKNKINNLLYIIIIPLLGLKYIGNNYKRIRLIY